MVKAIFCTLLKKNKWQPKQKGHLFMWLQRTAPSIWSLWREHHPWASCGGVIMNVHGLAQTHSTWYLKEWGNVVDHRKLWVKIMTDSLSVTSDQSVTVEKNIKLNNVSRCERSRLVCGRENDKLIPRISHHASIKYVPSW